MGEEKKKRIKIACKNTFNVLPYEGIVHDVAMICFQNLLKFSDVVILIGTSEKNKRLNYYFLKNRLVRLCSTTSKKPSVFNVGHK